MSGMDITSTRPLPGLLGRWLQPTVLRVCTAIERWAADHEGRRRVIDDHFDPSVPYLIRNYLLFKDRKHWWQFLNPFLHRFLRGDLDVGAVHDHPFPYLTIILSGGYWEVTPEGRFWHGPGSILIRGAGSRHRIELDPTSGPVYTLFVAGPRVRDWGFADEDGRWWVQHEDYLTGDLTSLKKSLARKPKSPKVTSGKGKTHVAAGRRV